MQRFIITILTVSCVWCVASVSWAKDERPPITQLPKDLARLAVVWTAIPHTMYEVSREDGPLMGMTVGPVVGSGVMMRDTATYLTRGYHDQTRANERRPAGALLHYSF